MKKKEPTVRWERLPVVVLYQGDIEELASILKKTENSTVSFELGDTVYDTLAELREHQGEVLREFEIVVKTHSDDIGYERADVSFKSDYVSLTCGATQELSFRRAREFLKAKCRWMGKVPDSLWIVLSLPLPLLVLSALPIVALSLSTSPLSRFVLWVSIIVSVVGLVALFSERVRIRRNLLFLKKHHEHAGFLKRHESHIVKSGIGLVFGILGYLIRLFQD